MSWLQSYLVVGLLIVLTVWPIVQHYDQSLKDASGNVIVEAVLLALLVMIWPCIVIVAIRGRFK